MMKTRFFVCFITTLLVTIPTFASAAEVVLKNGDRITGKIVKMEELNLEIDADYANEIISLDWEKVSSITSERPLSIKLYGDVEAPRDVERHRDRVILYHLEAGGPIRLEDVRAINMAEEDYRGYISIGGNQSFGNSETVSLNLSVDLTYRRNDHRVVLDGKYNRGEANGEVEANNGSASVKYDYFFGRFAYVGGANLIESDQFQDLTVRNTTSAVLGYDLLDSYHHQLTVAAGPAVVYEQFTAASPTVTPSATWLLRYEFRYRGDDVVVYHRQQGFKDLGHGSAVRVNADQGIRVKITGNLGLNLEFDLRYNSLPVAGTKSTDGNFIFGVTYDIKP
jgi:putative salt-induced outer membrane protein YdiY